MFPRLVVIIGIYVAALGGDAAAGGAPAPGRAATLAECSVLPRPVMRVRLAVDDRVIKNAEPVIRQVVEDVWGEVGIAFEWVTKEQPPSWDGLDAWIIVQHAPAAAGNPKALGSVSFSDGLPRRLIRISIDATINWVHRVVMDARGSGVDEQMAAHLAHLQDLTRLALGYATAHEIGHFVLASRDHSESGLMAAAYKQPRLLSDKATMRLDAASHARVADRLEASGNCPGLNAR